MTNNLPNLIYAFIATLLTFLSNTVSAQYKFFDKPVYEIGIGAGPANMLGDLGGRPGIGKMGIKDNNIQITKLMKGGYFTVRPSEFWGVSLSVNFATLIGDDKIIDNKGGYEEARFNRNLTVRTPIVEGLLTAEIYPTVLLEHDDKDVAFKFRPYGVLGIGLFRFNPQAQLNDGTWVDLQPLRTEGQGMANYPDRKPYSLTQISIPYGVGLKYYFTDKISAAVELVTRKTFTDYLDDVSTTFISPSDIDSHFGATSRMAAMAKQVYNKAEIVNQATGERIPYFNEGDKRGTATNNDAFYAATLKLGIRFGDWGKANNGVLRCPIRF